MNFSPERTYNKAVILTFALRPHKSNTQQLAENNPRHLYITLPKKYKSGRIKLVLSSDRSGSVGKSDLYVDSAVAEEDRCVMNSTDEGLVFFGPAVCVIITTWPVRLCKTELYLFLLAL